MLIVPRGGEYIYARGISVKNERAFNIFIATSFHNDVFQFAEGASVKSGVVLCYIALENCVLPTEDNILCCGNTGDIAGYLNKICKQGNLENMRLIKNFIINFKLQ